MVIVGGVIPGNNLTDDATQAYTYDCILSVWNSFRLPSDNYLNRQGASGTNLGNGLVYIWGGKRSRHQRFNESAVQLPSAMYQLDSINPWNSSLVHSASPNPPLRYSHTQTLVKGHLIVILGGFDSLTGDAVSMKDIWIFDTLLLHWKQVVATLDNDNKPANRSSHSQVLMSDDSSILIYGGYDGYHVFNDVAVLDTRSWTWMVKNTSAVVQGRADHTATLIGNNMIVAFGFTGVSTSLTVMSDVEVLDITTWSWTSYYIPSPGYPGNGETPGGESQINLHGTPSMTIVAGAVTGGVIVFVLVIMTLYIFNFQQKQQERALPPLQRQDLLNHDDGDDGDGDDDDSTIIPRTDQHHKLSDPFTRAIFSTTPSSSIAATSPTLIDPFPSTPSSSTSPFTATHQRRKIRSNSLLPSPWKDYQPTSIPNCDMITTAISLPINKPDEPCNLDDKSTFIPHPAMTPVSPTNFNSFGDKTQNNVSGDDNDDGGFDRQEFILQADEISSDPTV
ncbi:hypothetical protein BCR42DRAFT_412817 [Absidia repens]|uniref:Galactose oxidase n=1 Tax=Absidia repens TaxID=90262 RepID=A0A1X2IK65_9FUNG|nr:hypothetical protein BCR42DRAFT_412817 [Absidia repens]